MYNEIHNLICTIHKSSVLEKCWYFRYKIHRTMTDKPELPIQIMDGFN